MDRGFLDYASYVIRDRAIPNLADGLKPVQRRILWALHEKDDGRFIKVANVVGHTMQYHPHGDASIGDALVVLANKRYLIEGQGNFGNIFTGDPAAAPRYIECRLTELARTEVVQRRDHRVRSELRRAQQGTGHAAVQTAADADARHGRHRGRSGRADSAAQFPRAARSADRHSQEAAVQVSAGFPDRRPDGRARLPGRQRQRQGARQDQDQGRVHRRHQGNSADDHDRFAHRLHRRRRRSKGKLKVKSINDFTSENVEIEIKCPAGVNAEKLVDALYAFTDCEVTIASRIIVIKDNRPVELTVTEVLRENTEQLVDILKRELELQREEAAGRTAFPHAGTHLHRGAHLQEDRAVQDERGGDRRGV